MYVYETRERTRHEHSTLHTSIQYVHNVALTRAHRHEHVDVALQLRAVSTLHTWHKVTHLPRISPPPRNMASSPSLLAWPDRGGRAACRGHGCDTLHTTPCTPCCPVAQPLRSPPPPSPPTHCHPSARTPVPVLPPHGLNSSRSSGGASSCATSRAFSSRSRAWLGLGYGLGFGFRVRVRSRSRLGVAIGQGQGWG